MPSVYDDDAFETRVNYAAACIAAGRRHTRHFDTCFEMYDGDFVAAALVRRALKNPQSKLAAHLFDALNRDKAMAAHEHLKDVPRSQFRQLAAEQRARSRQEFFRLMEQKRQQCA